MSQRSETWLTEMMAEASGEEEDLVQSERTLDEFGRGSFHLRWFQQISESFRLRRGLATQRACNVVNPIRKIKILLFRTVDTKAFLMKWGLTYGDLLQFTTAVEWQQGNT